MVFYKIEAVITDLKTSDDSFKRSPLREFAENFSEKSESFYQKSKAKHYVFVAGNRKDNVTFGMITRENDDIENVFRKYQNGLPFKLKKVIFEEITFKALHSMLNGAYRNGFVYDNDDVLDAFEIGEISDRHDFVLYGEAMLDSDVPSQKIFEVAEKNLFRETLRPELERIYTKNTCNKFKGHPVHYIIKTDERETRMEIYRTLLTALYDNGRVQNKRYCFVDYDNKSRVPGQSFEALYKSCEGGAMIIRYGNEMDTDGEFAKRDETVISALCETAVKYKNKVLTIICLPRVSNKVKELFLMNFGLTSFVEIFEDVVFKEKAQEYLKNKAKQFKIKSNKTLTALSEDENKGYTATELNCIFDEWYDKKLRNTIYPQYKQAQTTKVKLKKEQPKGSAYEKLQELIGLTEAKNVMNQALNFYKAQKLFADRGYINDRPAMHMVFTGNPGTAKTTVARLFAQIMKENGLLSKGDLYEVGRGDIVGKYVGSTAPLVQKAFRDAKGSVLFIDEAYSLVDDRDGLFGDEAINTIVQEMENNREDMVVIFAGYPDKMEGFLDRNPGLRSRIAFHIPFEDYNSKELCDIARLIAGKKGLELTEEATEKLEAVFESAITSHDFGNGRYARNIIEKAKMKQANRLVSMDYDKITDKDIVTLCAEDIEEPIAEKTEQNIKIGFAV